MSCQIFTSILFPSLKNIQEGFAEVSESDVEKFIEGEENANTKSKTFYDLKLCLLYNSISEFHNIL